MARNTTSGTGDYLQVAPTTAALAMTAGSTVQVFHGWLRATSIDTDPSASAVFELVETLGAFNDGWAMHYKVVSSQNRAIIYTYGANTGTFASGVTLNTWHHVLCIYDQANTTVEMYVDNVSRYSNTSYTNTSALSTPELRFAQDNYNTTGYCWGGDFGEFAFLNKIPDAGQRAALAAGYRPDVVMPASVLEYWPLIRGQNATRSSGNNLSQTGTVSVVAHPRTFGKIMVPWVVVPAAAAPVTINCALGTLVLAGQASTISATGTATISAALGTLTLAGQAATISATGTATVSAALGTMVLAGQAATVSATGTATISAALGTLTLAGQAATVSVGLQVNAALGTLTLAGQAASVSATGTATVAANTGALVLAGQSAAISATGTATVAANTGTLVFAGLQASITFPSAPTVTVVLGLLSLAGLQAKAMAAVAPAERIYSVLQDDRTYSVLSEDRTFSVTED